MVHYPIDCKGDISATSRFLLLSVLHVPKFTLNLLSINHPTKSLDCIVTFFPSYCVFQDLVMSLTIGQGLEVDEMYLLDTMSSIASPIQQVSVEK